MSRRASPPPCQVFARSEFDREIPRLGHTRTIRPAKARPILNACTHGGVHSALERKREHGHGGEGGVLQQLAEGEFEVVHGLLSVPSAQCSVISRESISPSRIPNSQ